LRASRAGQTLVRKLAMHRPGRLETIWFLAARSSTVAAATDSRARTSAPRSVPTRRTKRWPPASLSSLSAKSKPLSTQVPCPSTCRSRWRRGGRTRPQPQMPPRGAPRSGVGHGAVREDPIEHRHGSELARPGTDDGQRGDRRSGSVIDTSSPCTRARHSSRWARTSRPSTSPGRLPRRRESPSPRLSR